MDRSGVEHQRNLLERTQEFGLRAIKLVEALPKKRTADVLGHQLLRSATSVGANYRAAKRARSRAEFVATLGIVEEEADECIYWMQMIVRPGLMPAHRVEPLEHEAEELLKIIVASIKTSRRSAKK